MERSRALVVVAVLATLAVAAAVVVWLQGQEDPSETTPSGPTSSTSSSASSPTTTPEVLIGGTPGPGFVTTAPDVGDDPVDLSSFSSPTGNIGCFLSAEVAACEIGSYDFELPPEPATCDFDWGAQIELTDAATPPTLGACKSDTQLGAPDQLAYGSAAVVGDFACLSQEIGMTCWNQITGRGFTLARAAYALF